MCVINRCLRFAAAKDWAGMIGPLLILGADPYATGPDGRTAFNCAASNGLRSLDLLTRAAFTDTQKPENARRWKNYGVNTPTGRYGSTLITYAAKVSPAPIVMDMIRAGADIAVINGSGWTLLHCASVMPKRLEVLKALINVLGDQGCDKIMDARTTCLYETEYDGHKVSYAPGLTAEQLCRARIDQDPQCPAELSEYAGVLSTQ